MTSDPAGLLRHPGEATGERRDADQRLLHHRKLQGLHHAAGVRHKAHRAQEDGGHAAGEEVGSRQQVLFDFLRLKLAAPPPSLGLLPCPVQGGALHPPALVLHHHLQCGQTADEEQAAGEGEDQLSPVVKE